MIIGRMKNFSEAEREREFSLTKLVEMAYSEGYEAAQKEFGFKTQARKLIRDNYKAPFSKESSKGLSKLINKSRAQLENVGIKSIGASPERKRMIDNAVSRRATSLAGLQNAVTRDAHEFLSPKQMENILRR